MNNMRLLWGLFLSNGTKEFDLINETVWTEKNYHT